MYQLIANKHGEAHIHMLMFSTVNFLRSIFVLMVCEHEYMNMCNIILGKIINPIIQYCYKIWKHGNTFIII